MEAAGTRWGSDGVERGAARQRRRPLRVLAAAGLGYLVGTFPSADLAGRLATGGRSGPRSEGSGNPGALNTMAVVGPGWGYAVLAADIAKGALGAGLGRRLAGPSGANVGGAAAVVGHCHPVWSGFRGGKGVAASVGQVLVTFPVYLPLDAAVAALTAASPRWRSRSFAATTVASCVWVSAATLWWRRGWRNGWGPRPEATLPAGALASSIVIHRRFAAAARATDGDGARPPTAAAPVSP